jgi:hypothetical protein
LSVGDVAVDQAVLPIVPDALGGAEGVLGSEGLAGKRVFIDFRHDQIVITYSRNEPSGRGFIRVPFYSMRGTLVVVDAMVGEVRTRAIIDTGGQATISVYIQAMETDENAGDSDRHGYARAARHAHHRLSPARTAAAHAARRLVAIPHDQ